MDHKKTPKKPNQKNPDPKVRSLSKYRRPELSRYDIDWQRQSSRSGNKNWFTRTSFTRSPFFTDDLGTLSVVFSFFTRFLCFCPRALATPPCPSRAPHPTQRFSTYAIKDTVSVLYWYGILSRNGKFIDKIFGSFFLSCFRHAGLGHVAPNAPLRRPSVAHLTHKTFHRIRPYLAENTILPSDL